MTTNLHALHRADERTPVVANVADVVSEAPVDTVEDDGYVDLHAGSYASRNVSRGDVADYDDAPGNRVIGSSASNGWPTRATHSAFSDQVRRFAEGAGRPLVVAVALCALLTGAISTTAAAEEHVITDGDSLWLIAELHGVDLEDLQRLNGLSSESTLTVGDRLLIPDPPWTGPVVEYIVEPGDAMSLIAEAFGVDTDEIIRLNSLSGPAIQIGQVLRIPDRSSAATDAVDAAAPQVDDGFTIVLVEYIVEPGDALSVIAEDFDVAMTDIMVASGIGNADDLTVGSVLQIPTRVPTNPMDVMAERFEFWAEANNLDPNLLKALGWQESRWQEDAVSYAGAVGVTQIMPYTADFITTDLIGQPLSRENADDNIRMGARYLAYLLELTGGDEDWALASYYQGFTNIERGGLRQDTINYVGAIQAFRPQFEEGTLPPEPPTS